MPHQPNETLRKSIHIALGAGALTLRWMPWWAVAAVCAFAILGNWLILHRIVGSAVARHERGFDAGIVIYPAALLALLLVFRERVEIVAVAWTTLAFGDGFATLAGRSMRIASLPWNRTKSWAGMLAFVAAGIPAGLGITAWLGRGEITDVILAVVIAAVVESLPLGVDDNATVPFAAAATMLVAGIEPAATYVLPAAAIGWIAGNTVLAALGFAARSVDASGAIGGWALGTIIILGGGWPLYVALLAFFVIGTATTKLGYTRKASRGLAQEKGGRRGFGHAFSNVGVATICAIAATRMARSDSPANEAALLPLLMAVASLATAAADTTASEIGQLLGRRPFLPLTLRRVETGTEGAISVEGTLAGLAAGLLVAAIGSAALGRLDWSIVGLITASAFLGSYLESIAGSWNRRAGSPVANGALNFFNTAAGALLMLVAWEIAF